MIQIDKILQIHKESVANWHNEMNLIQEDEPWMFIEENMKWNFQLWHEEDIARIKDIDLLRIVEAKRNIDKYNQARNNAMEKIDEWVLGYLLKNSIAPGERIHSETPGMMIDRLAIMALKKYHMEEETNRSDADAEHIEKCKNKVSILNEQINDLSGSLNTIFSELVSSKLRFKVYRQLKMYNDPELNPQLYNRKNTSLK